MKTTILFLFLMLVCSSVQAELWVKHDNGTIQGRYAGDCYKAGFCEVNNSNISPGWIEVDETEYQNAGNKYYKVEGGEVVAMTQAEKDAVDAAIAQAEADAQAARDDKLQVTLEEAFTAWVQVYNSKVPEQYRVTKQELINQVKANR